MTLCSNKYKSAVYTNIVEKGVCKRAFLVETFLGEKCSVVCCAAQQILIDINKCFTSTLEKITF